MIVIHMLIVIILIVVMIRLVVDLEQGPAQNMDVLDMIQLVMIQMLHYGKTVNLLRLHVMLHKQNVLNLNLMIAVEYPVVVIMETT